MQMEALECGAASLGMILAYWKKWLPLEQLRIDCGVSRDGSNALNLLKAARKYGMEAKGFRMEVERLRTVEAPAILHWNFCHFVVFNGFKGDKVSLNDPARGRVLVDADEFNRSFTGIVLTFKPGPEFRPSGQRASVLSFVRERMRSAKAALLFTFLTGLLMAFVGLIGPLFSQIFMDDILSGKNPDWFRFLLECMRLSYYFSCWYKACKDSAGSFIKPSWALKRILRSCGTCYICRFPFSNNASLVIW